MGCLSDTAAGLRPCSWPCGAPPAPRDERTAPVDQEKGIADESNLEWLLSYERVLEEDIAGLRGELDEWYSADAIAARAEQAVVAYHEAKARDRWWCSQSVGNRTTCSESSLIHSAIVIP